MASKSVEATIEKMRGGAAIRFGELAGVCRNYFGEPRISGSHYVYKMPWAGDPRINIQNDKGKAKSYQVKQVLQALDRLAQEVLAKHKAAAVAAEKSKKK